MRATTKNAALSFLYRIDLQKVWSLARPWCLWDYICTDVTEPFRPLKRRYSDYPWMELKSEPLGSPDSGVVGLTKFPNLDTCLLRAPIWNKKMPDREILCLWGHTFVNFRLVHRSAEMWLSLEQQFLSSLLRRCVGTMFSWQYL